MIRKRLILTGILLVALTGPRSMIVGASASEDGSDSRPKVVIGRISTKPTSQLAKLEAMSEYLAQAYPGENVPVFDEIVVPNINAMADLLRGGKVDLISETPLGAVELEKTAGVDIVLLERKKGVAEYSGILVTHMDSGVQSLDDLTGKVIAFEDRGSTSAFLLPLAILRQHGLKLVELTRWDSTPPEGHVGYIFAEHEINVSSLVARGKVAAGALSDLDWTDPDEVPSGLKRRLKVFYTSEPVLRSLILMRGDMDPTIKSTLIEMLADMHNAPGSRSAMKKYNKVQRFDRINDQLNAKLAQLRELHGVVRDKIR